MHLSFDTRLQENDLRYANVGGIINFTSSRNFRNKLNFSERA